MQYPVPRCLCVLVYRRLPQVYPNLIPAGSVPYTFNTHFSACWNILQQCYDGVVYAASKSLVSVCIAAGVMYTESRMAVCRYGNFERRGFKAGGLALWEESPHRSNQRAVGVASCLHIWCRRQKSNARHFASKCVNSQPPLCLGRCSVDSGTRKTLPFHRYQDSTALICVMVNARGGKIWAKCQAFAKR
jgi:hypothetical protein